MGIQPAKRRVGTPDAEFGFRFLQNTDVIFELLMAFRAGVGGKNRSRPHEVNLTRNGDFAGKSNEKRETSLPKQASATPNANEPSTSGNSRPDEPRKRARKHPNSPG